MINRLNLAFSPHINFHQLTHQLW